MRDIAERDALSPPNVVGASGSLIRTISMRTTELIFRCEEAALKKLLDSHQNHSELLNESKLGSNTSQLALIAEQRKRMMNCLERHRAWHRLRALSEPTTAGQLAKS